MQLDFKGKTILVSGGTRGIGKQIANDLCKLGAFVIVTGTKEHEIEKLNKELEKQGINKKYLFLDFLNKNSVDQFLIDIEKFERIDGLVNNAGINRLNSVQCANKVDWDDMLNVNLSSPFQLINAISPKMINHGYGRIVNVASIFGVISKEKRAIYSATKFGLHGLTVGSSNDLARFNILVNTVSPGFVLTDLTKKNLSQSEMNQLSEQVPIKRMAETNDISSVVVFLLSELNQYLTGQNIIVDGGFTNV